MESRFGESSMDERMVSQLEEKDRIARKCGEFVHDGDCIYIDSGSTTYQIAKYVKHKKKLTVVTNSLPVAIELMDSDVELIMIGGKIRREEQSVVAYEYIFNFHELNVLKAFICCSGITIEKAFPTTIWKKPLRAKMIELSKEVVVMADSTKFGKDVTISIASLDKIDTIVTDANVHAGFIPKFKNQYNASHCG